jgi:spermidine synthase
MSWTLIDSAAERDTHLALYEKDGTFMIRANGLELMNGFNHESEAALGAFAAGFARSGRDRFLVGGLGLGYTAAALLDALGGRGSVTVVELVPAVIDWFQRHVRVSVLPRAPESFSIVNADIVELLAEQGRYDVVVFDVDNGPEPLVTAGNARLYSSEGLRRLHGCLSDAGVGLLWSGFESEEFARRAEDAGFNVTCEPFRRSRADLDHYVYVLEKNEAA